MLTDARCEITRAGSSVFKLLGPYVAILWKDWPREMTARLLESDPLRGPEFFEFAMSGECPHCHDRCLFVNQNHPPLVNQERVSDHVVRYTAWAVMQCVGCGKYILGAAEAQRGARECKYVAHYPMGLPDDSVSEHIPEEIAGEFKEALKCQWIDAPKAVVLMCRRALQVSCDKEQAGGRDLNSQIEDLFAKGRITKPLQEMAHEIRLLGRVGAHGDYSDIDATITTEDAIAAVEFMRHYLDHIYVLPAKLAAARSLPKGRRSIP